MLDRAATFVQTLHMIDADLARPRPRTRPAHCAGHVRTLGLARAGLLAVIHLVFPDWAVVARAQPGDAKFPAVTLTEDARSFTLANRRLSVRIQKSNGNLVSLQFGGLELLSRGQGYWSVYGTVPGLGPTMKLPEPCQARVVRDPSHNGGQIGEVAFRFAYQGQSHTVPLHVEYGYGLHAEDSGVYTWMRVEHPALAPGFELEQATLVLKLNPDLFDYLIVDEQRQREMIRGEDWVRGEPLNLKEARRIVTGKFAGRIEHKYDYAARLAEVPAYGWASATRGIGLWMVNPSLEYINGGPIKVELTGHIDGKPQLPADPTLLFVWHGCHYGGKVIVVRSNECWTKVAGPVWIYANRGQVPAGVHADALARAAREQAAWPYDWARIPGYASRAERGCVRGRLVLSDPYAPTATAAYAWVGLAAASYTVELTRGRRMTYDWQLDGRHYQYWVRADQNGEFHIDHARPGEYVLYAFTDGVLGDFAHTGVVVRAGATNDLGTLTWVPRWYGRPLWQIGIPNRSAEEFRHGDHYWQWGLYLRYPEEFPHDVDFLVGVSDWRTDWNYAQPPRPNGRGGWTDTTWRVRFVLDHAPKGTAVLRLGICGARGGPVRVAVNGRAIGDTGELPESGVMHRDGIRGVQIERNLPFDAALLHPGTNVIELTKSARQWTDGVLYDVLRLELAEP